MASSHEESGARGQDFSSGVARPDPTANAVHGDRLHFHSSLFTLDASDNEGAGPIASLDGALLTLSFRDDKGHHSTGSAVMVGPALALCAFHVLEDDGYYEALQRNTVTLVCEAPAKHGLLLWTVHRISRVPGSDLAVLAMSLNCDLPPSRTFTIAKMTTRFPCVGETLTFCGFTAVEKTQPRISNMSIGTVMRFARGKVLDVYPDKIDNVMVPSPGVSLDVGAFGGMSGGPVFDQRGYLVGILSASFKGSPIALVSHLWPALVRATTEPVWPCGMKLPSAGSLLQLGRKFSVHIERPDAFELCGFKSEVSLRYVAWS